MTPTLFLVVLLTLAAELILSVFWAPFYFTRGVLLYKQTVAVPPGGLSRISEQQLRHRLRGGVGPGLLFKKLSDRLVAFREPLFDLKLFQYSPVMHGLLRLRPDRDVINVEGRANWFVMVFCAVFAFDSPGPEPWTILAILAGLLGAIYAIQVKLYRRLAKVVAAADRWEPLPPESPTSAWRVVLPVVLVVLVVASGIAWWLER